MAMDSRSELTPFLDRIASRHVAPAGGSAAAVVGAIGAALAEMTAIHTLQREHIDRRPRITEVRQTLSADRSLLVGLSDADARVVDTAFGGSPSGLSSHTAQKLVGVPLATAEACLAVYTEARNLVSLVGANLVRDLQTAITLVTSALRASMETAQANLDLVEGATRERLAERLAEVAESVPETM
jgi:formiminotetrahydrofolate cyclodeaminase